jgi:hypothetical protein
MLLPYRAAIGMVAIMDQASLNRRQLLIGPAGAMILLRPAAAALPGIDPEQTQGDRMRILTFAKATPSEWLLAMGKEMDDKDVRQRFRLRLRSRLRVTWALLIGIDGCDPRESAIFHR